MARFLIVEARFYDHLNDMLVAGARAALEAAGHDVDVLTVPGALEIPGAIALASESGQYDGYVGIGVVIRGETYHFEIVAGESARGIMALTMDGMAIGNGILTVENEEAEIQVGKRQPYRNQSLGGLGNLGSLAGLAGGAGGGALGSLGSLHPSTCSSGNRSCDTQGAEPVDRTDSRPLSRMPSDRTIQSIASVDTPTIPLISITHANYN